MKICDTNSKLIAFLCLLCMASAARADVKLPSVFSDHAVLQRDRLLTLMAKSDAGLPVKYFVVVGPTIVKDGSLVFTQIPPRTKFPVTVTVAAWQWGRGTEPKVKTAEIVKQSFQIIKP